MTKDIRQLKEAIKAHPKAGEVLLLDVDNGDLDIYPADETKRAFNVCWLMLLISSFRCLSMVGYDRAKGSCFVRVI